MPNRALLLVGAGTSCAAGYPATDKITERVMSGREVFFHTDGHFYLGDNGDDRSSQVRVAREIIEILIPPDRFVTYEDAFTLVDKLRTDYHSDLTPFSSDVLHLASAVKLIQQRYRDPLLSLSDPGEAMSSALDFITDVTVGMLLAAARNPELDTSWLSLFSDVSEAPEFNGVDIFTLNHDKLLEDYFSGRSVDTLDGFSDPEDRGISFWMPDLLRSDPPPKIRLHKLHGSIDWFWVSIHGDTAEIIDIPGFGPTESYRRFPFLAKVADVDFAMTNGNWPGDGKPAVGVESGRPSVLIGRETKFRSYSVSPYLTLLGRFRELLDAQQRLVVIGYSWQDVGVNRLIDEWQMGSDDKRILYYTVDDRWFEHAGSRVPFHIIDARIQDIREVSAGDIVAFIEVRE